MQAIFDMGAFKVTQCYTLGQSRQDLIRPDPIPAIQPIFPGIQRGGHADRDNRPEMCIRDSLRDLKDTYQFPAGGCVITDFADGKIIVQ